MHESDTYDYVVFAVVLRDVYVHRSRPIPYTLHDIIVTLATVTVTTQLNISYVKIKHGYTVASINIAAAVD